MKTWNVRRNGAALTLAAAVVLAGAPRAYPGDKLEVALPPSQEGPQANSHPSGCVGADCPITITPANPPGSGIQAGTGSSVGANCGIGQTPDATGNCPPSTGAAAAAPGTGFTTAYQNLKSGNFGLPFQNAFNNMPINIPPFNNWTTSGLCGGMVYTALDQMNGVKIPSYAGYSGSNIPGPKTAIYQYIYNRQLDQLENDSTSLLGIITDGNSYAQQGIGVNFSAVMAKINGNTPVTLALRRAGADLTGHTILAVGYSQPAYNVPNVGSMTNVIFVYDPNTPEKVSYFFPNSAKTGWTLSPGVSGDQNFTGYFVDNTYNPKDGNTLLGLLNQFLGWLSGGLKAPPHGKTSSGKMTPAKPMRTLVSGKQYPLAPAPAK